MGGNLDTGLGGNSQKRTSSLVAGEECTGYGKREAHKPAVYSSFWKLRTGQARFSGKEKKRELGSERGDLKSENELREGGCGREGKLNEEDGCTQKKI